MEFVDKLLTALNQVNARPAMQGPQLFGTRLTTAAAAALDVDAVSLVAFTGVPGLWYPIGASDGQALAADDRQALLGEGPLLETEQQGVACYAPPSTLTSRWPQFAHWLSKHTGYDTLICEPVPGPTDGVVFTAYLGPANSGSSSRDGINQITRLIASLLSMTPSTAEVDALPVWMNTTQTAARQQVAIAAGMLAEHVHVAFPDAVALLRAHCFAHDISIDALAAQIVDGLISVSQI